MKKNANVQILVCENCGQEIKEDYRKDRQLKKTPQRFCSRKCARSFSTKTNRLERNKKTSETLKARYHNNLAEKENLRKRTEPGRKKALLSNKKKWEKWRKTHYVRQGKDTLDITYWELEEYRKTHPVCEMCGAGINSSKNAYGRFKLATDHDHNTKHFRGLLCNSCNRFVGFYENNKEILYEYLNTRP